MHSESTTGAAGSVDCSCPLFLLKVLTLMRGWAVSRKLATAKVVGAANATLADGTAASLVLERSVLRLFPTGFFCGTSGPASCTSARAALTLSCQCCASVACSRSSVANARLIALPDLCVWLSTSTRCLENNAFFDVSSAACLFPFVLPPPDLLLQAAFARFVPCSGGGAAGGGGPTKSSSRSLAKHSKCPAIA